MTSGRIATLLATCIGIAGCQRGLPTGLEGTFSLQTEGRVLQFESLASSGSDQNQLILSAHGDFWADPATSILSVRDVTLDNLSLGERKSVFRSPRTWTMRISEGGIEVDRLLTPEEQWIAKGLASYWRASKPEGGKRSELEWDGRNTVQYSVAGPAVARMWLSREADRPDLLAMPNRESIPIEAKVSGELSYMCPEGYPREIRGSKSTVSSMGGRKVGESRLQVVIEQRPCASRVEGFRPEAQFPLVEKSAAGANEVALQRQYLGGASLDSLLERARSARTTEARNEVFLAFRALFYLHPDQCSDAVNRAESVGLRDLVAEALAAAGHGPGQTGLLRLLHLDGSPAFAKRIAFLIPITALTPSMEKALLDMAFGNRLSRGDRYVVQLVVGSNIRRCLTANPDQAERLSTRLVEALRKARTEDDRLNLLYAMGNAGNESLLPQQLAFLSDPSPILRKAAAHSLRHVLTEETRGALRARAGIESSPDVRQRIEEVLEIH